MATPEQLDWLKKEYLKPSYQNWQRERQALGWFPWDKDLHATACPLCRRDFSPDLPPVWDHHHACAGQVPPPGSWRGFLCHLCNRAEGQRYRRTADQPVQRLLRDKHWQQRLTLYLNAHKCELQPRSGLETPAEASPLPKIVKVPPGKRVRNSDPVWLIPTISNERGYW